MTTQTESQPRYEIKSPSNLSPRIQWLRDYYFQGVKRKWNNEYTSWTTGTPWDFQYNELSFYIVPETYGFLQTFRSSFNQTARKVELHPDFWSWSLPERRAWFNQGGDGAIPAQRGTPRRPDGRRALQHHDIYLPDKEGSPAAMISRSMGRRALAQALSGSTTTATAMLGLPPGT